MTYARMEDSIVVQVLRVEPHTIYTPEHAERFVPCPENVEVGWLRNGEAFTAPPAPPQSSQFDLDEARYKKRAAAKDSLLAYMAADNMSRVRSGVWTVPQLMSLMDDPAVVTANAYMSTLSYELAAQAIASTATPLLTPEIRADWVARLQAHFYLE